MVSGTLKDKFKTLLISKRMLRIDYEIQRKIIMMNLVFLLSAASIFLFVVINLLSKNWIIFWMNVFLFILFAVSFLFLRRSSRYKAVAHVNFSLVLGYFYYLFITGGIENSGGIWFYIYPLLVYFVAGLKLGSFYSFSLMGISLLTLTPPAAGIMKTSYSTTYLVRFFVVYSIVCILTMFFEYVREKFNRNLVAKNQALEKSLIELEAREKEIEKLAFYDTLTGLSNRILLMKNLEQMLTRAWRDQVPLAILFLDLDDFKTINESVGHETGDKLLVHVAQRIKNLLRKSDVISRFGGDSFVILLPEINNSRYASIVCKKLIRTIREPINLTHGEFRMRSSIGIALDTEFVLGARDLLKFAEIAMYKAKERGGDRYIYFRKEMNEDVLARLVMEKEMHEALEKRQFEVYYQPKINIRTGALSGFEALVRWNHPEKGMIRPDAFIPLAEDTGLIEELGILVAELALEEFRKWCLIQPDITISINLSPRQFRNNRFLQFLQARILELNLQADNIELEFTEGLIIKDAQFIRNLLDGFTAIGIKLSIDDFGTGYSSLSYLKRFDVSILKIDKSFIDQMNEDKEYLSIVKAIIGMGKSLKLKVIAEGVETPGQIDLLKKLDCDEVQGYFFSPPISASRALEYIENYKNPK